MGGKMKKLVLVLALLLCFVGVSHAVELEGKVVYSYSKVNTSGAYLRTAVPVTSIYPGVDKIVGYSIMGNSTASENVIAVYDSTSPTLNGEVIGEAESIRDSFNGAWLPYPREIESGIVINQGPNTTAVIYFIRN